MVENPPENILIASFCRVFWKQRVRIVLQYTCHELLRLHVRHLIVYAALLHSNWYYREYHDH